MFTFVEQGGSKLTDLQHGSVPTSELRQKRSGHQRNETIHEIVEAASFGDVKTSVFDGECEGGGVFTFKSQLTSCSMAVCQHPSCARNAQVTREIRQFMKLRPSVM